MIFMITIAITVRAMETAAKRIALCSAKATAKRASLCVSIITGTFFKSSVAKLIIQFTFLLITQNIIGFIYFLKMLCCRSISLITVRMIFLCQFSVCFLNRCCICVFVPRKEMRCLHQYEKLIVPYFLIYLNHIFADFQSS